MSAVLTLQKSAIVFYVSMTLSACDAFSLQTSQSLYLQIQLSRVMHTDIPGPVHVVPFVYDFGKRILKVATKEARANQLFQAIEETLSRFYNQYNLHNGAGELFVAV